MPAPHIDQPYDDRPIRAILEDAIVMWEELTGVRLDQNAFTFGNLDLRTMNEMLKEAIRRDEGGATAYMMLECFLRYFLEEKTFTAAQIMQDYAKTTDFLSRAEKLFSVLQSDRAVETASEFRSAVRRALKHYGADRPDVLEMLDDNDVLPFLRRDALRSMDRLTPYQFLSGEHDPSHPTAIQHVFVTWSMNDLLLAARDMMASGIAMVLIRDPAHPDRSHFAFVMRNGGNVIVFTDKSRPAYPGQDDVLAARGGRGSGRRYAARENANHFPYQIIPTSVNEDNDIVFDSDVSLVVSGKRVVPAMRISDLPPSQAIWATMMFSLLSEKFWKQGWRAEALSYTAAMIRDRQALVKGPGGALLPVASGYQPITLGDITLDDVTRETVQEGSKRDYKRVNTWLEERYRDNVPQEFLNVWSTGKAGETKYLPTRRRDGFNADKNEIIPTGIVSVEEDKLNQWDGPSGVALSALSKEDFGTEEELRRDRIFIARHNMAKHIQRQADDEFENRRKDIMHWYRGALHKNRDGILRMIAEVELNSTVNTKDIAEEGTNYVRTWIKFGDLDWDGFRYTFGHGSAMGEFNGKNWDCLVTQSKPSYKAVIYPHHVGHLLTVTGLEKVEDLPDVLRHWQDERRSHGNHLLDRIDPMEWALNDPWCRLDMSVGVYLSKRGLAKIRKD